MYSKQYFEEELQPGVAVFLRPTDFPDSWTRWVCNNRVAQGVAGDHYFVTLKRIGSSLLMTPAFSAPKPYRVEVTNKSGLSKWVDRRTFFDPCQLLLVPIAAVIESAEGAGDESVPGSRNRVGRQGLMAMAIDSRSHPGTRRSQKSIR